jgi:S-adenosylmethionine hydrolase
MLVLMTDFGLTDGSVSEVRGLIYSIDPTLNVSDLSHDIPPFSIRHAAYRLFQVAPYWPCGTFFVCVVDPGVGTNQEALLVKSKTGHYFVSPNNGILTFIEKFHGIQEVFLINQEKSMLPTAHSHTSYGRDLYAYVAAQLASGQITPDQVGAPYLQPLVGIPMYEPFSEEKHWIGTVEINDSYGNIWTNFDMNFLTENSLIIGKYYKVRLFSKNKAFFDQNVLFGKTYACALKNDPILYINSMHYLALGLNQGNFYEKFGLDKNTNLVSISIEKGTPKEDSHV